MSPRRFLLLCAAFLLLVGAVWAAFFAGLARHPNLYSEKYHAMVDAKLAFSASRPSPKLVCIGGSSTLYGVHARTLEALTGMPVVNLGLTVTLSPDYLFALARRVLKPGDVLLVSLEYVLFADEGHSPFLIQYVLTEDPAYFGTLPWTTRAQWVFGLSPKEMRSLYRGGINAELHTPILGRRDAWGDLEENHDAQRPGDSLAFLRNLRVQVMPPRGPGEPPAFASLRRLHAWCRSHGVRLAATWPPLARGAADDPAFPPYVAQVDAFYRKEGIPLLGTPWEALRPPETFFDNPYHLTWEGAEARAAVLAAELEGAGLVSSPAPVAAGRGAVSR